MDPFIGQIMVFGGNFAPRGFALCDGQLLPINQYQALFSILGTTYGGDGRTTFALPDLRGRAVLHAGHGSGLSNKSLGQKGGEENVTLGATQMPVHNHSNTNLLSGTNAVRVTPVAGDVPASAGFVSGLSTTKVNMYGPATDTVNEPSTTVSNSGGGQSHTNMQPYNTVNYCIAFTGIYPSRN